MKYHHKSTIQYYPTRAPYDKTACLWEKKRIGW